MNLYNIAKARIAENKKQADTNKMTKYLSEKNTNYVGPDQGARGVLSKVIKNNTDEHGRAQPSCYKKDTPPTNSSNNTESFRAKADDFLASAIKMVEKVSKQSTPRVNRKKNTTGLTH
ncbi:MAG: hypothetical protein VXZ73_03340 [Pseudomonadota bacterium]|nr:hypothetical protein [Pseudomonadota bacterium]MEC8977913.1 hypothetical protein [Pseudomonadota bacterium]